MPTPPPGARRDLLTAVLDGGFSVDRVRVVRVELAPAQTAGAHLHPCPVVGCVLSGAIRFQVAGEPETTLQPGDAFFEPANAEISRFDNASEDHSAVFVAYYLLPPGEERLIEMFA